MAFNLQDFVTTELGVADEEARKALIASLEPHAEKLGQSVALKAEHAKAMKTHQADVEKKTKDLEDAERRLNAEIAEWGTVRAKTKDDVTKAQKNLDAAQGRQLKLEQTIRKMANDYGLDAEKLLAEAAGGTPSPKVDPTPEIDLSGYVKADDIQNSLGQLAQLAINNPVELMELAREHEEITGETLDLRGLMGEFESRITTKGNQKSVKLRDIWEEQHEIPSKREAKAKAKYDADLQAAEQRGREAALSELKVPGGSPPRGQHSPVLVAPKGAEDRTSALERPQPGTRFTGAVSALRTGKYAGGNVPQEGAA